jgi:hypothetical protein
LRLFLDANVLFGAPYSPEGRSAALFSLAGEGLCSLASSRHAIEEAARNLALKAPDTMPEFERLLALLEVAPEAALKLAAWQRPGPQPTMHRSGGRRFPADLMVTGDRTHPATCSNARLAALPCCRRATACSRPQADASR